jgi:MYXO-CTERM domain-containing protein
MNLILLRVLAFIALSAPLLGSVRALACSCEPQTVEQAKQDAVAIFQGRVTAIVAAPASGPDALPEKSVTLEVARRWRGVKGQGTVTLRTAESGATCGYGFVLGTSYLIYAAGEPAKLEVHSCSRTRPVSDAGEDLAALGEGDGAAPKSKRGGCASAKASASAAPLYWLGASGVGLLAGRRRRR